jgi:hypothetical protein
MKAADREAEMATKESKRDLYYYEHEMHHIRRLCRIDDTEHAIGQIYIQLQRIYSVYPHKYIIIAVVAMMIMIKIKIIFNVINC